MDKPLKIKSFTDLKAWKEAHSLVLKVYTITKKFPKTESYSLIDQMRRCSVSISSNIAEGFSRQTKKEKLQFYSIAKGSLTELQNQLMIAKDVKYLGKTDFNVVATKTVDVHKLLNGLSKSAENKQLYENTKY